MESDFFKIIVLPLVVAVVGSAGFWAFVSKYIDGKSSQRKLLIGIAHDRIVSLGMAYLERGDWITKDEYENLYKYLFIPYEKAGGNGSAARIMADIDKRLRIVNDKPTD